MTDAAPPRSHDDDGPEWFPEEPEETQTESEVDEDRSQPDDQPRKRPALKRFRSGQKTKATRGRQDGQFKLGIIGGASSGKTSYLYALGRLKYHSQTPLGDWAIGGFTQPYQEFYSRVDNDENRRSFQRTRIDTFNIFDMFPVSKKRLQINLRAFDAAGENFAAAVNPVEFKKIPKDTERYHVVRQLQEEILSCEGFIFLIDCELSNPMFAEELRALKPGVLLPHQLLLHFSSFLSQNGYLRKGKIQKPIALVLTKADYAANDSKCPLKYFNKAVASGGPFIGEQSAGSPAYVQGMREAERFIQIYFDKLYNVANDFSNRSFHAISCWGHAPDYYYYRDGQEPDSRVTISRDEVQEFQRSGQEIHVWVKDIRPVCVEEPLRWILSEIETRVQRLKRKRLVRYTVVSAACLIALVTYPFLGYTIGILFQNAGQTRAAEISYTVAETHPFFKQQPFQAWLGARYFSIVDDYLVAGNHEPAGETLDNLQTMVADGLTGIQGHPYSGDDILERWMALTKAYLANRQYDQSYACLERSLAVATDETALQHEKIRMVMEASSLYTEEGLIDRSVGLMRPLFEKTLADANLEGDLKRRVATQTVQSLLAQTDHLVGQGAYPQALETLEYTHRNAGPLGVEDQKISLRIFTTEIQYAETALAKREKETGREAIERALEWLPVDKKDAHEALIGLVQQYRLLLDFDTTLDILAKTSARAQLTNSHAAALRDILIAFLDASLKSKEEREGLERADRLIRDLPDPGLRTMVKKQLVQYARGLENDKERLAFVSRAQQALGGMAELKGIEAGVVLDMAYRHLRSGRSKEAITLLDERPWMKTYDRYPRYRRYAAKAVSMVYFPASGETGGFYIDRYEVSNRDYAQLVKRYPRLKPAYWGQDLYNSISPDPDSPVVLVSWSQASEYARRIGKRLPSVKEWERAWGKQPFPYGSSFDHRKTNTREHKIGNTLGRHAAAVNGDKSRDGVYALLGNVQEYTQETMLDESGGKRAIVKGGCFIYPGSDMTKSRNSRIKVQLKLEHVGFRCAMGMLRQ